MKLPGSDRARRTTVYLVLVGLTGLALVRQQQATDELQRTTDELHALIDAEEAEERVEEAVRCLTSWEVREEIRKSDEAHGRAGAEALITVVDPDDPAIVAEYRQVLADYLRGASDELADPTCDRAHALVVLDRADRD